MLHTWVHIIMSTSVQHYSAFHLSLPSGVIKEPVLVLMFVVEMHLLAICEESVPLNIQCMQKIKFKHNRSNYVNVYQYLLAGPTCFKLAVCILSHSKVHQCSFRNGSV